MITGQIEIFFEERRSRFLEDIEKYNNIIKEQVDDNKCIRLTFNQAIWLLKINEDTSSLSENTIAESIEVIESFVETSKKENLSSCSAGKAIAIIGLVIERVKRMYLHVRQLSNLELLDLYKGEIEIYLSTKEVYLLAGMFYVIDDLRKYILFLDELIDSGSNIVLDDNGNLGPIEGELEMIQRAISEVLNILYWLGLNLDNI